MNIKRVKVWIKKETKIQKIDIVHGLINNKVYMINYLRLSENI